MKKSRVFWPLFIFLVLGFLVIGGTREISASHRPWCPDKHSCIFLQGGGGKQPPQPPLPGQPGGGKKKNQPSVLPLQPGQKQPTWGGILQWLKGGSPCK